ncbi:MAG: Histidine kinase, gyrase and HSP90-like ATPase [Thermoleophilaceae bacterium]|nr:Histidine kinase, gyrase and HSP90-like ATPase [Thermoleophilaceae bacterium]
MSWWSVAAVALCWAGWSLALAAGWTLHRRLARVADAEHELRGAATAIALAGERELSPLLRLELDRMTVALADLAEARGARPAPPSELEAGRLAQVLANVIANAAEHGVGPVEVSSLPPAGGLLRLEIRNRRLAPAGGHAKASGRGRGLVIAKRAARELGGRVSVESEGDFTRTVVELPAETPLDASRDDRRRAA